MARWKSGKIFPVMMVLTLVVAMIAVSVPARSVLAQGGTWNIQTVDDSMVFATSIAVDSNNRPHISYISINLDEEKIQLKHARWTGTAWNTEVVDDEIVPTDMIEDAIIVLLFSATSIALDSNDCPHISYISIDLDEEMQLRYARWTGTEWNIEIVDGGLIFSPSLALDSNNFPNISYIGITLDYEEACLKYARWTGIAWNIGIVDGEIVQGDFDLEDTISLLLFSTSIAMDSNNCPHISYIRFALDELLQLRYARWTGTDWNIETLEEGITFSPSLTLGSNDRPHISYMNIDFQCEEAQLRYARWTGTAWNTEIVDSEIVQGNIFEGDIFLFLLFSTSIAVDGNNWPHISYLGIDFDCGEVYVEYTRWTGADWVRQILDENIVFSNSLALGVDNSPHISYASFLDVGSLYYACPPKPPHSASVFSATGTGMVTFDIDTGGITGLTAIDEGSLPTEGKPSGVTFPHGLFSFKITNIAPGSTVNVTITFPSAIRPDTQYWKCHNGNWFTVPIVDRIDTNVIIIQLIDGGLGDADGIVNGIIVDPGGPAAAPTAQSTASESPSIIVGKPAKAVVKYLNVPTQQVRAGQPVTIYANITNSGDESGSYKAVLKINGEVEKTVTGKVGAHAAVPLKFEVIRDNPGTYTVDINGQQSYFTITGQKNATDAAGRSILLIAFILFAIGVVIVSVLLVLRRRPEY